MALNTPTALPLPTGAATAAKQPALGTAGTASADVISIQGVASGTAVPVSSALSDPAGSCAAAVHSDTVDLANSGVLWVGTGGNVKIDAVTAGTGITFTAVPDGSLLPVRTKKVYSTGTTATNIVVLY